MSIAGTIFREYVTKAAVASKALEPAIAAAPNDAAAAIYAADLSGANVSVLIGAGHRTSSYTFGKFLSPINGGVVGLLFSKTQSAAQAHKAAELISTGTAHLRGKNVGGAVDAWTQAKTLLDDIAGR